MPTGKRLHEKVFSFTNLEFHDLCSSEYKRQIANVLYISSFCLTLLTWRQEP